MAINSGLCRGQRGAWRYFRQAGGGWRQGEGSHWLHESDMHFHSWKPCGNLIVFLNRPWLGSPAFPSSPSSSATSSSCSPWRHTSTRTNSTGNWATMTYPKSSNRQYKNHGTSVFPTVGWQNHPETKSPKRQNHPLQGKNTKYPPENHPGTKTPNRQNHPEDQSTQKTK